MMLKYEGRIIDGAHKNWTWVEVGDDFHSELYILKNVISIMKEIPDSDGDMTLSGYRGFDIYTDKKIDIDFSWYSNGCIVGDDSLSEIVTEEIDDGEGGKILVDGFKDKDPKETHIFLMCSFSNPKDSTIKNLLLINKLAYLMNDDGKTIEKLVSLR